MGLPEVNRARIEILDSDVSLLKGEVESIDTVVYEDSFPDTTPGVPQNVSASALFRNIQVMWMYSVNSYIAAYEVYASQTNGFIPSADNLVWKGKAGAFNHSASVGQTWHFRVRSINTHGTASGFAEQVSATTVDISGAEIEEVYRIDTIEYANQYTRERELEIMQAVADKADYQYVYDNLILKADTETVNQAILRIDADIALKANSLLVDAMQADLLTKVDAAFVNGQLVSKADNTTVTAINDKVTGLKTTSDSLVLRVTDNEAALTANGGTLVTLRTDVDATAGTLSTTVTRLTTAEGTISSQGTAITQNSDSIALKANQLEVDTLTGTVTDIDTELGVQAGEIALKASQSSLDATNTNVAGVTSNVSSLTLTVDGITSDVGALETTVGAHGTEISSTSSKVTQLANDITSKVDSAAYTIDQDGVISSLDAHNTRITQNATAITSKVSSTAYDAKVLDLDGDISAIDGRLSSAETTITQHDSAIALRAVKTDVYTKTEVNNSLSGKADNSAVTALDTRVDTAEAELIVQSDAITSKVSQTSYNQDIAGVVSDIDSHETRITQNSTAITSKVENTTFDTLKGRVTTAESNITQQAGLIDLRVTKTTYDSDINDATNGLIARMNSAEASITTQAGQIDLKASQVDVDTRIGDVVDRLSTAESSISVNATSITSKVATTTYSAGIQQLSEDYVKYVDENTGNVVQNTSIEKSATKWQTGSGNPVVSTIDFRGELLPVLDMTTDLNRQVYSDLFSVDPSKAYEVTLWFYTDDPKLEYFGMNGYGQAGNADGIDLCSSSTGTTASFATTNPYFYSGKLPTSSWVKKTAYIMPVGTPDEDMKGLGDGVPYNTRMLAGTDRIRIRWLNWSNTAGSPRSLYVAHPKVVEVDPNAIIAGVKARLEVSAVESRVNTAESSISQNAGAISLKASQSALDTTNGRLSTAEGSISVQAGLISSKVEKDGVISSINQSAEEIKIDVAQLTLNGDLVVESGLVRLRDAIIDSVHIKDDAIIGRMIANSVITNTMIAGNAAIDFAKIGNVTITNAMISSLDASKLTAGSVIAASVKVAGELVGATGTFAGQISSSNLILNYNVDNTTGTQISLRGFGGDVMGGMAVIHAESYVDNYESKPAKIITMTLGSKQHGAEHDDPFNGNLRLVVDGYTTFEGGTETHGNAEFYGNASVHGTLSVSSSNRLRWSTYGGEIYMQDSSWLRINKPLYASSNNIRTDAAFELTSGTDLTSPSNNTLRISNTAGYMEVGNPSTSYGQIITDRADLHIKTSSGVNMVLDAVESFQHQRMAYGNGLLKFLNGSLVRVQVRNRADTAYGELQASNVSVTSNPKYKKNLAKFARNTLKDFLQTPIYEYNMIDDNDTYRKSIGAISTNIPVEIAEMTGEGVDLYGMTSYQWRALQQLIKLLVERNVIKKSDLGLLETDLLE